MRQSRAGEGAGLTAAHGNSGLGARSSACGGARARGPAWNSGPRLRRLDCCRGCSSPLACSRGSPVDR